MAYLGSGDSPRFIDGRRALHLLRRLWICNATAGSFDSCEHSEDDTKTLARNVAESDMTSFLTVETGYASSFAPVSWLCGPNGNTGSVCTFDLSVEVQVAYFSLWYDVMSSQPGLVSAANLSLVAEGLLSRINLFRSQFLQGHWTLWNGNNWTPRLADSALYWVIAFWHEETDIAREVLQCCATADTVLRIGLATHLACSYRACYV